MGEPVLTGFKFVLKLVKCSSWLIYSNHRAIQLERNTVGFYESIIRASTFSGEIFISCLKDTLIIEYAYCL